MGQNFDDFKNRLATLRRSDSAAGIGDRRLWTRFWRNWRVYHHCSSDEELAAYCESRLDLGQRVSIWWHIRRCVMCRAELFALRHALSVEEHRWVELDPREPRSERGEQAGYRHTDDSIAPALSPEGTIQKGEGHTEQT